MVGRKVFLKALQSIGRSMVLCGFAGVTIGCEVPTATEASSAQDVEGQFIETDGDSDISYELNDEGALLEEDLQEGPLDYLDLDIVSLRDFDVTLRDSVALHGLQIGMSKAEAYTVLGERGFAPITALSSWSDGIDKVILRFHPLYSTDDYREEPVGWYLYRVDIGFEYPNFALPKTLEAPPVYPAQLAKLMESKIGPSTRWNAEWEMRSARRGLVPRAYAAWCSPEDPLCRKAKVFSDLDSRGRVTLALTEGESTFREELLESRNFEGRPLRRGQFR